MSAARPTSSLETARFSGELRAASSISSSKWSIPEAARGRDWPG
jgi:hypothetical protein